MFQQTIDKTFIGTSDPVVFKHSLSYFGPEAPDTSDFNIVFKDTLLDAYVDSHAGISSSFTLSYTLEAGASLPAWAASITAEGGEITSDTMKITITDNTVMGGMYLGAKLTFNLSCGFRFWEGGHWHWDGWHSHWVGGHWGDWHNFNHSLNFDILPFALDFLRSVADDFPKLKILNDLLPQGIINNMQDFEYDIANKNGDYIIASMPFKWDLIKIGRVVAESGLEVASLGLTPAVAAVVTLVVELAELAVSLLDTLKVIQIQFGPEINCEFPLRVSITKLVAVDAANNEYLYDQLTFSDDKTITGSFSGSTRIGDSEEAGFIKRIGVHCRQSIEVPLQTNPGVWAHLGLFWIFAVNPAWDFNLIEEIEKHFGVDLGLVHFDSSMIDDIGGKGTLGDYGGAPPGVDVKFL